MKAKQHWRLEHQFCEKKKDILAVLVKFQRRRWEKLHFQAELAVLALVKHKLIFLKSFIYYF